MTDNKPTDNHDNKGRFTKGNQAQKNAIEARGSKSKKADIKAYCQRNSMRAAKAIMAVVNDPNASPAERIKGAQYIIDRGHGKPETAGNSAAGLFAGATIMVDTGIRREAIDVTPTSGVNGQAKAIEGSTIE